jgi:hypothetical protein
MPRTPATSVLPLATVLAIAAAALPAQTTRTLPVYADAVDGHASLGLPFGTPGFRTQIVVDGNSLAPNGAVLNGISFRADRWLAPVGATVVPNVSVALSHTNAVPGAMTTSFATHVTGPTTVVFQGNVNLPAQGLGAAGPLPWNVDIAFTQPFSFTTVQGNLLVDIVGNNAPGGTPSYSLDAVQGGGTATQFGVSGPNPSFDTLLLVVATGNDLVPRQLSPGHTIDFVSTLFFTPEPGVLALGTTTPAAPVDLGPLGAPSNFLYVDPLLFAAHTWAPSFLGWFATFSLTLPSNPGLIGATVFAQSAILVPAANPLGVVLSHGVEVRIGDEFELLPLQQLDANDPNAATGTLVDFSFGPTPEFGAAAVRFDGTFF